MDIVPALAAGFLVSGVVYELVPEGAVYRHLGRDGIKPVLYATVVGTLLPVCCWGSLPIAVSLRQKGAKLGPILAFLVTTPATSVSALIVAYIVMGSQFAVYIFFAVIAMGLAVGLLGNGLRPSASSSAPAETACASFSVVFGVLTYLCSTASVPLVHSLINQGLAPGAGMTLLLIVASVLLGLGFELAS